MVNKETIIKLKEIIRNLYLADDIPWVIGYSGGKDSTATLQLVWLSLEEMPTDKFKKPVHIINTDTLVESPVMSKWVKKSLQILSETAEAKGLPFVTHRLTPPANDTFWVNLIGRGYPFPRKKLRWCTDRLKIQPVNEFVKSQIAEHGEIILVLGTRKAESANRAKTMAHYEKMRVRELLSPNPTLANELVFSPLEDWTDDDVWAFLMQYPNPWGYSNKDLLTLYRGATSDGECPLMVEKGLPSCGRSRFGCWVCTMVERDKSMEAMINNDDERKLQGYLVGSYKQLHHGPYLKEVREEWLRDLLIVQKEVNATAPEEYLPLEIITVPELRAIRRIWVYDKHEFEDSLPRIYHEILGEEFDDPDWIGNTSFGMEEWNTLENVVFKLFPDEELAFELAYSLIDIENRSNNINKRKDTVKELENCIKKTFYKNEEDAREFYLKQESRKRDYGGKYNEKALDTSYDEENQEIE